MRFLQRIPLASCVLGVFPLCLLRPPASYMVTTFWTPSPRVNCPLQLLEARHDWRRHQCPTSTSPSSRCPAPWYVPFHPATLRLHTHYCISMLCIVCTFFSFTEGEQLQLEDAVMKQIEYYFSRQNLATDAYLVSQMDSEMWVPISTIAGFKVRILQWSLPTHICYTY